MLKRLLSSDGRKSIMGAQLVRACACIAMLGVFCAVILGVYAVTERGRAVDRVSREFASSAQTVDRYLEQMKYTFAEISAERELYAVADGKLRDGADYSQITDALRAGVFSRKQNEFSPYLETVFIVPHGSFGSILASEGAYRRDMFFSTQYNNSVYTDAFWQGEMQKEITFEFYPAGLFESAQNSELSSRFLTPVAYKIPENENFIMVGLLDLGSIPYMDENTAVFDRNGRMISASQQGGFEEAYLTCKNDVVRVGGGYMLRYSSQLSGVTYYHRVSDRKMHGGANIAVLIMLAFLLALCGAAFAIALRGARRDDDALRGILSTISDERVEPGRASLASINTAVEELVERNAENTREITQKDSLIRAVMLQSRMRDIYVSVDDMESQLDISREFILIYFRVNFRDNFREISEERGKVAFYLKQLIEMYLANAKLDATTFQVESDQIVSVVNVNAQTRRISAIMESVVSKLNNEGEYVFFTIVISEPYDDISALKRIYDHMYAISKYARPVLTETQMLRESDIKPGAGRFYFSVEQMEKLTAMLQNENPEDSVHLLDEILDYNIKKDVNGFDLYLLCTEIVNCAVKLINRLFHTTPASLRVAETYSRLDKAVALDEYREICRELIEQAVEYIRINKREEDYIISYILDYIENHYTEDIYLNLFAEKLKLTAAYISTYFKNKMNVNLSDYINSFRIKKAIAIVEDGKNPMLKNKEIAEKVGIQNINTFIRLFKKYTGYTPGEYRKKHVSE